MQEKRLIRQLQEQNPAALEALIAQYAAYVGTIVRSIGRNVLTEADVEELTADVFFSVWQNTGKLQAGKLRAYLAQIARNRTRSRLRVQKESLPLEEEILLETANLEEHLEHLLLAEALQEVIAELSAEDRAIIIGYYYYYQRVSEIAQAQHKTEAAVKVRLHRARRKIKDKLLERGYVYGETEETRLCI